MYILIPNFIEIPCSCCSIIVPERICIFIDCTCIKIKFIGTMLTLPLGAFFEIATARMIFIISGTALILLLGVYDETATGRVGLYF